MNQRLAIPLIQVLFWGLTLLTMSLFVQYSRPIRFPHVALLIIGVGTFYGQSWLAQRYIYRHFSRQGIGLMVGVSLVGCFLNVVMISSLMTAPSIVWIQTGLALVLYFSLSGFLCQGFCVVISQRRQQHQLEKEKIELELSLVRSQLNPHFLFNVLNNIDHYVRNDPAKASQSIIKLSSLLRYLLYETAQSKVPLDSEVAFLEEYFDLQQQRVQTGTTCHFKKEITDPGLMVVPGLFLPFLENAFRHCPLNQPGNFVYIELVGQPGKITFISRNTRQLISPTSDREGLGLALAQKRLMLLYPNAHHLSILETDHHYSVELVLAMT